MPRNTAIPETLTVDDNEYVWQYRHGWGVDYGRGIRGVSVSVWLEPGHTRELVVDFPFSTFGVQNPPRKTELVQHLVSAIRSALTAGWVPDSRGKVFRFDAPELV